jgi:chemosensory pili system protein ChpA (sensor histidine kinase/response regulator)
MSVVVTESLSLIHQELLITLAEARSILENYIDSDGGAADLGVCANALHSARGALQIAEANGASLLAEEMELTCRMLVDNQQSAPTDQGIEALTRAIVQLPAYVETIMVGGRDIPLVLLPLLNDLRAARSKPLLSESTLLLLDTGVSREEVAALIAPAPNGQDIKALAKSLRTRFQLGLLGWIKGGASGNELESMHQVAGALEQAASVPEVHQLWWVVGGVIDALRDGGLDTSVAIKRLMGQADREIKRLASQGERVYTAEPPTELLNNLLYYVARATTQSGRVSKIREAYNLIDLIPGDDQVEQLRQMLAAPSANLMRTVADAIRQDLTNAKDVLDIYARTGMENVAELEPQVEMLRKISDTLGVLGLARLREAVAAHSDELRNIVQAGEAPEESRLIVLAAALLRVEDALDAELIALVESPPTGDEAEFEVEIDSDYQQVTQAVMRECVVNIARIKDAISGVMGQTDDRADINELESLLSGVNAGLAMLGKDRALATLDKAGEHIIGFVRQGAGHLPLENLNRLADAIVSLEYYLETIQNGRKEPMYMLDNADRCLEAMAEAALTTAAPDINVGSHEATMKIEVGDLPAAGGDKTEVLLVPSIDRTEVLKAPEDIAAAFNRPNVQTPTMDAGVETQFIQDMSSRERTAIAKSVDLPEFMVLRAGDDAPDPELLEIFLEEAKECVEAIQREFPRWQADTKAHEPLATVRRSYHTLKGSGRMVGAELIGEYAWSVENLLNRIINNTLEPAAEVVELLRQSVATTPELIEQLEVGVAASANVAILIANAHGYADRIYLSH